MSYFLNIFFYVNFFCLSTCLQNLFQSEHRTQNLCSFLELRSTPLYGYDIVYFIYLQPMDCFFPVFANVIKAAKDRWMVLPILRSLVRKDTWMPDVVKYV